MTEIALLIPSIDSIHEIDHLSDPLPEVADLETEGEKFMYCPELWVKRLYSRVKDIGKVKRIYFGNEFCERLVPSIVDVKAAKRIADGKGLAFTLVTTYGPDEMIRKTEPLLDYLNGLGEKGIEVVVNDTGVMNLVQKYTNLEPVLGRLKDPMKRMSRFVNQMPQLTEEQAAVLSSSNLTNTAYLKFLLDMGFRRVELDLVPQGIGINFNNLPVKASFYYPWTYLTVGRVCELGSLNLEDNEKFTIYNPCQQECKKYYSTWFTEWPGASNKIIAFGRAVFMLCEAPENVLRKYISQGFDRIVYQPVPPI